MREDANFDSPIPSKAKKAKFGGSTHLINDSEILEIKMKEAFI